MAANVIRQSDFLNLDRNHWMMRDLLAWCPMQEGYGLTCFDITNRSANLTLTNMDASTDWVTGPRGGYGLDFDGSNDYLDWGSTINPMSAPAEMTLSLWFNIDNTLTQSSRLLSCGTHDDFDIQINHSGGDIGEAPDGNFGLFIRDYDATWRNLGVIPDGWGHLVLTASEADYIIKGYINGSEAYSKDIGSWANTITNTSFMKRYSTGSHAQGQLSNIQVWGRVLTASEVRDLYLNPWAPFQQRNQVVVPTITAASIQYIARQIKIQNQRLILK